MNSVSFLHMNCYMDKSNCYSIELSKVLSLSKAVIKPSKYRLLLLTKSQKEVVYFTGYNGSWDLAYKIENLMMPGSTGYQRLRTKGSVQTFCNSREKPMLEPWILSWWIYWPIAYIHRLRKTSASTSHLKLNPVFDVLFFLTFLGDRLPYHLRESRLDSISTVRLGIASNRELVRSILLTYLSVRTYILLNSIIKCSLPMVPHLLQTDLL